MRQEVVYVRASDSDPNTSQINELCREMAEQGLGLLHVSPSQGEAGVTVGLWLFFSDLNRVASVADYETQEAYGSHQASPVPKRWST